MNLLAFKPSALLFIQRPPSHSLRHENKIYDSFVIALFSNSLAHILFNSARDLEFFSYFTYTHPRTRSNSSVHLRERFENNESSFLHYKTQDSNLSVICD